VLSCAGQRLVAWNLPAQQTQVRTLRSRSGRVFCRICVRVWLSTESAPSVWRVPPACLRAEDTAPEGGRTFVFRRIPSPKDVNHACSLCARGPVEAGHNPFSSYCLGCQSVLISVAHAFGAEVYPRMYAAIVESSSDEEGDWGPACVDE
jgi:hypothetical protein